MVVLANPVVFISQFTSNHSDFNYLFHTQSPYSVGEEQRCFLDHLCACTGLEWEVFIQLPDDRCFSAGAVYSRTYKTYRSSWQCQNLLKVRQDS